MASLSYRVWVKGEGAICGNISSASRWRTHGSHCSTYGQPHGDSDRGVQNNVTIGVLLIYCLIIILLTNNVYI